MRNRAINGTHKSSRNAHLCAHETDSRHREEGFHEGVRRSAASEGVPAALRLSKSAQSADKVHFSDSTRLRRARNLVRVTTVSRHKRSFTSLIGQNEAFFIMKPDIRGNKSYFLPLIDRMRKVQP